jgi:hypothetical protein
MSSAVSAPIPLSIPTVPIRQILPWAVFAGLLFVLVMYFVSTEQGALSMFDGVSVHELVHDGRHLLGFPCH